MSLKSVLQVVENHNYNFVTNQTFGHLAPEHRKVYDGFIVFTYGEYGDIVVIKSDFKGLPDSPWFFDNMLDFVNKKAKKQGTVYKFVGTYMMFKNGRGRFSGKVKNVKI